MDWRRLEFKRADEGYSDDHGDNVHERPHRQSLKYLVSLDYLLGCTEGSDPSDNQDTFVCR